MKYTDFKINGNSIEFHNSIVGKETVFVNGKVTSEKFSIFGTKHKFDIERNQYELKSRLQPIIGIGVKLELMENGELIETRVVNNAKQSIIWFAAGLFLGMVLFRIWR